MVLPTRAASGGSVTLIAFVCDGDHAEILTDSLSYLRNLGKLGETSKISVLSHFDAAVMSQGDGMFGGRVRAMAHTTIGRLEDASFDGLTREIRPALQDYWGWTLEDAPSPEHVYASTIYLVGYSLEAASFVAYLYASDHDFEPEPVDGLYVTPTPAEYALGPLERERLLRDYADAPNAEEFFAEWSRAPGYPVPCDMREWAQLGLGVRYTRALGGNVNTLVGGSLYFTQLEPGRCLTSKIWEFDDTGDELLAMVGYSQHPAAQARPCWCDSGKRHLDCHLAEFVDQPCGCGSDKLFRDCCMIHG